MDIIKLVKQELAQEAVTTRKFLALVPFDKTDWAPHEKSMKLMPLATHIVEIVGWPEIMLNTEKLDFAAGDYKPLHFTSREELKAKLDEFYAKSQNALNQLSEDGLNGKWAMYMGDQLLADFTKYSAIRHALNQLTHHRAQLGVYYRLNDIPVPGSYGPSADEQYM